MFESLVIVIVFIILMLAIIWGHFVRSNKPTNETIELTGGHREDTNVALYKEHKAEIEKDYAEGSIDEENYQYLLAELDNSLLQDIEQNKLEPSGQSPRHLSIIWPTALTVFILVFSLVFYSQHGAYEQLSQPQVQAQQTSSPQDQLHNQLKQLLDVTQKNPKDSEAWYGLGQLYVGAGQFENALKAFDKVIEIEGVHADLLGAKAQALYYGAEMKLTPEVQSYIDQALALDAQEPSTNILLGMHHFMNQGYQQAIDYWQKVIDSGRTNVNREALLSAITDAKSRLSLTGEATKEETLVSGPQLSLDISLTETFIEQLSQGEDKVVFVYAVPAEGGRMPVAAVKLNASDLPTTVVLNDARAMSDQIKLSDFEQVNVFAVVSQRGGAGIKPGDFKGELSNISVASSERLTLIIDTLVE